MKKLFSPCNLLVFVLPFLPFAQQIPPIGFADFGFEKPVTQVEEVFYFVENESIEKVEETIRTFNKEGNTNLVETKSLIDDSWSKNSYLFQKGILKEERYICSKPSLNFRKKYFYNKQNKVSKIVKIYAGNSKENTILVYKDSLLHQSKTTHNNFELIVTSYYSKKGNLYKEVHRQIEKGKPEVLTNHFFLEDKEILSYVEPKSYFFTNAYPKKEIEIRLKLIEDSTAQNKLLKGILRFDKEAPNDNLPFGLREYSDQTLQAHDKNKQALFPYKIQLYSFDSISPRDEGHQENQKTKLVEAEVDVDKNEVSVLGFSKISFVDGEVLGGTDFKKEKLIEFQKILDELDLH